MKDKCIAIAKNAREQFIDIIKSMGNIEGRNIEIKRDLGDFVDYMSVSSIIDGVITYHPTDLYPDGLTEDIDDLSMNELYDLIMAL